MTVRNEVSSFSLSRNAILQVVELAKAPKTSEEGIAEALKMVVLLRVAARSEVNSFPLPQNGVL